MLFTVEFRFPVTLLTGLSVPAVVRTRGLSPLNMLLSRPVLTWLTSVPRPVNVFGIAAFTLAVMAFVVDVVVLSKARKLTPFPDVTLCILLAAMLSPLVSVR